MRTVVGSRATHPAILALFVFATCALIIMWWSPSTIFAFNNETPRLSKVEGAVKAMGERITKVEGTLKSIEEALVLRQQPAQNENLRKDPPANGGSQPVKPIAPANGGKQPVKPITSEWARDKMKTLTEGEKQQYQGFLSGLAIPTPTLTLSPGDVVIDVGANLGKFTGAVRHKCPRCIIIAFEAIPEYAAYIQATVNQGDVDKTFVIASGLSSASGKAKFFVDKQNLGWNTLVGEMAQKDAMKETEVDLLRWDDLDFDSVVKDIHSKVKLIKIDTEGAEAFVLNGAHSFLESLNPKPVIYMEVAWGSKSNPNWSLAVKEFEWLFSNGWQRFDYESLSATSDVVVNPS